MLLARVIAMLLVNVVSTGRPSSMGTDPHQSNAYSF